MNLAPTCSVYLLEQDSIVTDTIRHLCIENALSLTCFNSHVELMSAIKATQPCCIIAANDQPSGQALDLMENLAIEQQQIPVIILGDHNDVHSAVAAIKAGAIDYIEKPTIYGRLSEQLNRVIKQRAQV
ncbi:response regulator [uncultured Endozoicomonas sp.]|uniref:response regulator n=1 Tax=uncultured Endozoicomonas sp. TaxID=432652 RepID=UPI00261FF6AF|nr:response regulator [uncultured Endozoicomonas sp.]